LGGSGVYRPKLALADSGNAVISWAQHAGRALNSNQIVAATRAPGERFGAPQLLAGVLRHAESSVVAANDSGEAVVSWVEGHQRGRDYHFTLAAAFRAPGGAFGRRVVLSDANATGPALAVLPSGSMLLAWRRNDVHRTEARVRSAAGVLGGIQSLSR